MKKVIEVKIVLYGQSNGSLYVVAYENKNLRFVSDDLKHWSRVEIDDALAKVIIDDCPIEELTFEGVFAPRDSEVVSDIFETFAKIIGESTILKTFEKLTLVKTYIKRIPLTKYLN